MAKMLINTLEPLFAKQLAFGKSITSSCPPLTYYLFLLWQVTAEIWDDPTKDLLWSFQSKTVWSPVPYFPIEPETAWGSAAFFTLATWWYWDLEFIFRFPLQDFTFYTFWPCLLGLARTPLWQIAVELWGTLFTCSSLLISLFRGESIQTWSHSGRPLLSSVELWDGPIKTTYDISSLKLSDIVLHLHLPSWDIETLKNKLKGRLACMWKPWDTWFPSWLSSRQQASIICLCKWLRSQYMKNPHH